MYSFVYDLRSKRANQLVFSNKKSKRKILASWKVICSSDHSSTPEVLSLVALHWIRDHGLTRKILIPRCNAYQMETNVKLPIKARTLFVCVCIENQWVQPKTTCICFLSINKAHARVTCPERENRNWFFIAWLTIILIVLGAVKLNFIYYVTIMITIIVMIMFIII